MKIKVFYPDRDGRISFTKKELENLLDEVYREGYKDGLPYYTWTSPYYPSNSGTITTTPLRDQFTYTTTTATTTSNTNADANVSYSSQCVQYVET